MNQAGKKKIAVIYDGECPVCSDLVLKRQIESSGFWFDLIDARTLDEDRLFTYRAHGYDLNKGMLVEFDGATFYGHDALRQLIRLSDHRHPFMRIFERAYARLNSGLLYRSLVRARLLLLKLLNRREIEY